MNDTRVRSASAFVGALLVFVGLSVDRRDHVTTEEAPAVTPVKREPQKIQYVTPGGTRILWTIDPDFSL